MTARSLLALTASWPLLGCGAGALAAGDPSSSGPGQTASASPTAASSTAARTPPSAPDAGMADGLRGALERSHTGQAAPTVVVHNGYPRAQHIFIDWQLVGRLEPGQSAEYSLPAGTHTVTGADSPNPDDHPTSLTEVFDAGYSYRYRISAK